MSGAPSDPVSPPQAKPDGGGVPSVDPFDLEEGTRVRFDLGHGSLTGTVVHVGIFTVLIDVDGGRATIVVHRKGAP